MDASQQSIYLSQQPKLSSSHQIYLNQDEGTSPNHNPNQQSLQYEIQSADASKVQGEKKLRLKFKKYPMWTNQEDNTLMQLYDQFPKQWKKIAEIMKTRSSTACFLRFKAKLKTPIQKRGWTTQQDDMLLQLYQQYPEDWKGIAKFFPRRNRMTCYNRFRLLKNLTVPQISRNWTQQQDIFLIELYDKFPQQWGKIASHFQNCNATNCYIRYKKVKNIRKTKLWTNQEDNLLVQLFDKFNANWKKIYNVFKKTRSMNAIKLRYYTIRGQPINKKNKWKPQQQKKLEKVFKQCQGNWYQIKKYFPNSSLSQIILEYYSGKTIGEQIIKNKKLKQQKEIESEQLQSAEYTQNDIAQNLYDNSVSNDDEMDWQCQNRQIKLSERVQQEHNNNLERIIKMIKQQITKQCLDFLNLVIELDKNNKLDIQSFI